jgi:hypothetical protein
MPCFFANAMCASKLSNCAGRPVVGAEEVQPRLTDRPHARLRGEFVDHGDRLAEHALLGIRGCFVGMYRHRREDARVGCRGPRRPPARLDVAARLDGTDDVHRCGPTHLLVERETLAVLDLEMRVIVVDGDRQRLGRRRI